MTGKVKLKAGTDREFETLYNRADAVAHRYGLSRYEMLIIGQQLLMKSVPTETEARALLAEAYAEDRAIREHGPEQRHTDSRQLKVL